MSNVLVEKKEVVIKPFNAIFFCMDCGRRKTVPCTQQELAQLFNHLGVLELFDCFNCGCDTFHRYRGHFELNNNPKPRYSRGYLGPIKKAAEVKKVGGRIQSRREKRR